MADIQGSWFNSGFYGHYRSKSRNDIYNEFRQLAKPTPPVVFRRRSRTPSSTHSFSKHDNRQSFMTDALIFQEGLGKRRIANKTNSTDSNLLRWDRLEQREQARPSISVYKLNYHGGVPLKALTSQISKRPVTSFDSEAQLSNVTSYRYTHGVGNPNRGKLYDVVNEANAIQPSRPATSKLVRQHKSDSVATCMTWHDYQGKTTRLTPNLTPQATPTHVNSSAHHTLQTSVIDIKAAE